MMSCQLDIYFAILDFNNVLDKFEFQFSGPDEIIKLYTMDGADEKYIPQFIDCS
jgi:hypothetical protein